MPQVRSNHISDLYHRALELPAAERSQFLRQTCGDDTALRDEVESLLGFESASQDFLERPAVAMLGTERAAADVDVHMIGRTLGAYSLTARIGAGGMGEVYRARDSKLGRDVAIKILPPHFMEHSERRARFAREARVLATLNHPHIGAIYGVEEADGITGLVLELVEGETLAERLERGPLTIKDALVVARQIAEALSAAHVKGIIHRDLKPANVVLQGTSAQSGDAWVKVLDFGLAKPLIHRAGVNASNAAAEVFDASAEGRIIGTPGYMSPEQARGQPVDRRTDVWAFGCVLYEMLTGHPVFARRTFSDTLVSVLGDEPDLERLPPATPPAIRRLLRRCLSKDAKNRLHDIADARIEIDETWSEPTANTHARGSGARRGWPWRPMVWAAAGAAVALLVTTLSTGRARPPDQPRPLMASSFLVQYLNVTAPGVHFAVAPSGRTVAFSGISAGIPGLYRRDLDRVDPERIGGTDGGMDMFFSPDGRTLGFETVSELWTARLGGGTPQRLLPNQPLRGGTWGEGDRIVFGRVGSGLWSASAAGGEARQMTVPQAGERHELPQLLPGDRAVLFTILATNRPPSAAVHMLESGETRRLFEGIGARFVRSGHVVFGGQGKLWAVGFDLDTLQTQDEARPVRDDVLWSAAGYPQFTIGGDLLAYVRSRNASGAGKNQLALVDRHGKAEVLPLPPDNYLLPGFSPAGDRLVFQVGAARELWSYDLSRRSSTRLTTDRVIAWSAPTWTPDGTRVVVTTWFDGEVGLGWLPADGSGPVEVLVKGIGMRSFESTNPVLLPDGSGVVMTGLAPGASVEDLLFVPLRGKSRLETLVQAPGVERNPAIAPNGRFIAYNSDESGRPEVYVRPFPDAGTRRWQVSTDGGAGPAWTRGGKEIVFSASQGRVMAAAVHTDSNDAFIVSKPEPLFTFGRDMGRGVTRGFDVTADGQRFVFVVPNRTAGSEQAVELTLIQHWVDELTRLVPREP